MTIEVQEIEHEVCEGMPGAFLKSGLQFRKAGSSVGLKNNHFAIEDRAFDGKLRGCAREFGHPIRPIEALAC